MTKFKVGDYLDTSKLSGDQFIEIHQLLEDNGEKMYESTKSRKRWGFGWRFLYYNKNDGWCGSENIREKEISIEYIHNILNVSSEPQYEIY